MCANSMSAFSTPKSLKEREGKWMRNELPLYSTEAKERERERGRECVFSLHSIFFLTLLLSIEKVVAYTPLGFEMTWTHLRLTCLSRRQFVGLVLLFDG